MHSGGRNWAISGGMGRSNVCGGVARGAPRAAVEEAIRGLYRRDYGAFLTSFPQTFVAEWIKQGS